MKRLTGILAVTLLSFLFCRPAVANLASSRHNLSASGPGTIKATAETELCIFCHIPHNANPGVPLWNHTVTAAAYTMYTSDYLTRAGYATPSDVGQRSRLCLSCHDGTVAIGSVYAVRAVSQVSPIAMGGVDPSGKMPSTAAGYLGTDLRDDHPVSVKYDTGITIAFGSGIRTMELNATAPPINPRPYTGVKLYGTASGTIKGYVECTSCHDPHNDTNTRFLVVSNTGGALCSTCHGKTGWSGSIHQTSTRAINNPAGDTQPIPGTTVAAAGCMTCHKNHSGLGTASLLRKPEENTCFNGTSTSCHGTAGAKNVATVVGRAKSHPVSLSGKHRSLDVLYSDDLGSANRHAECYDCHSPHQARDLPRRVAASSWYPAAVTSTSNLLANSGPLMGATGVDPAVTTLWTARTTYTTMDPATKEYQICYKCHSWYAIRNAVNPIASWSGVSSAYITDQAWEFSPGNRSAHPIETGLNSMPGSYYPQALASAQNSTPFSANMGSQTMYCSDCHGADNENTTDPKGPHGSTYPFMLKGPNKYWPADAAGNLYTLGYKSPDSILDGLFCKNCHPLKNGSTWYNRAHSVHSGSIPPAITKNVACVVCHTVVPHGSRVSRLIAYQNMGAPYTYNGTGPDDGQGRYGYLLGFKKPLTANAYGKTSCYTTSGYKVTSDSESCSGAHGVNMGGYD